MAHRRRRYRSPSHVASVVEEWSYWAKDKATLSELQQIDSRMDSRLRESVLASAGREAENPRLLLVDTF